MALTAAEQAELAQLETEIGSGLTPSEAQELAQLEAELGTGQSEKVINEMPEGLEGRFVYKNFGADPVASFNYLQKENPDFELKTDKSGEVLARKRGTKVWGRLDPKGFDWRDITDVAYDVPAAVAQGAVTAASGIAGAPAGGIGAIPAAMAGSAVSGAGLEALRQAFGRGAGIEDNFSGQDVGIALGAGAVSPLLFGTGAGVKEAIKAAGKEGAKQSAKEILQTQRGLLGRGYDAIAGYVGPKLGSLVSGENAKVIKKAAEILPEIKAADTNPEIRSLPLKEVAQEVPQKLKQVTTETGKRLEDLRALIDVPEVVTQRGLTVPGPSSTLTGQGMSSVKTGSIPSKEFLAPFEELAEKLSSGGARTEAQMKDLTALKKVIESEFKGLPENLTAAQVDTLRKRFKERAQQYGLNYGKTGQAVGGTEGASAIDAQIALAFEDSRRKMNEAIIKRLEAMDTGLADEYAKLNDQYSYLKTVAKENNSKFRTSKSVSDFLARSTKDDLEAQNLLDIQSITGVNLEDLATRDQALRTFSKPNTEIRSLGGTTSTSRSIPLALAGSGVGGLIGANIGQAEGGQTYMPTMIGAGLGGLLGSKFGSPAALRKYMEANQLMRTTIPQYGIGGIPYSQEILRSTPYLMMNTNLNDQGAK